ncbi:MAG: metal ABC transporter permease [Nitrososphaeraceae archaeon]
MLDLFEFLSYGFMQRAILSGLAVASVCSVLGLFLVLKRQSLFGDALSHMAFGGIALGSYINVYPIWTAIIISISSAIAISKLQRISSLPPESLIALMLSFGLGIGVLLISMSDGFTLDLFSFLFGSILLINFEEILLILFVSTIVILIIILFYHKFIYIIFDEKQAKLNGININYYNYLFASLSAITVIASMKLVGILLISSLLVLPNITALLFKRGFKQTIVISLLLSNSSVFLGITLSYFFNLAPSGAIVMTSIFLFILVLSIKELMSSK